MEHIRVFLDLNMFSSNNFYIAFEAGVWKSLYWDDIYWKKSSLSKKMIFDGFLIIQSVKWWIIVNRTSHSINEESLELRSTGEYVFQKYIRIGNKSVSNSPNRLSSTIGGNAEVHSHVQQYLSVNSVLCVWQNYKL